MTTGKQDPETVKRYAQQQYRTPANLNARKALHEGFSTNPRGWQNWYMDQLGLPESATVLELGCGTGDFWRTNLMHLPACCRTILTDMSPGMLNAAWKNVLPRRDMFAFAAADAQAVPFPDASFDVVIANHMIYHIPYRALGIREMRRVLRPGGRLYAATNGERHMVELDALVARLAPVLTGQIVPAAPSFASTFTLENGIEQLRCAFSSVTQCRYSDSLAVTQAQPLVDYVFSMIRYQDRPIQEETRRDFLSAVEHEIQERGAIQIGKDAGILIAE